MLRLRKGCDGCLGMNLGMNDVSIFSGKAGMPNCLRLPGKQSRLHPFMATHVRRHCDDVAPHGVDGRRHADGLRHPVRVYAGCLERAWLRTSV